MNKLNARLIVTCIMIGIFCIWQTYAQEIKFKTDFKKSYLAEINDSIPWFYVQEPETKKPAFKKVKTGVYITGYGGNFKKDFFKIAKRIVDNEKSSYYLRITLENAREAALTCDEFLLPESAVLIAQDLEGNLLTQPPYTRRDNLKKRYIKNTNERMLGNDAGIYSLPNDFVLKLTINNNEIDSCNIHLDQFWYSFKENEQKNK